MSRVRVYIKTFDALGNLASTFTDITEYVDVGSLGTITQELDQTEYNVGIIRNSNFTLKLDNKDGLFSTPDIAASIFRLKRDDSIIKVTYDFTSYDLYPGYFYAGAEIVSDEYTVFEGILNDDATTDDAKSQIVTFQILGYESILQKLQVPFSSIANGNTVSQIIYACLNQSAFTQYITVNSSNISLNTNMVVDDITTLENKSVLDAFKDLLLISNSVLYIDLDKIVYAVSRAPTAAVQYTFYGQASDNGIENISELKDVRTGVNKTYNYWSWKDTTLYQTNISSASRYGTRNKEIDNSLITNTTSRNTILLNLTTEFGDPKKEFLLKAIVSDVDLLSIFLLDRVSVDYPQIILSGLGNELPIYDVDVYDSVRYPGALSSINIESGDSWKVMRRKFDLKTETIEFYLRAV